MILLSGHPSLKKGGKATLPALSPALPAEALAKAGALGQITC